jgi:hypothetical protein
MKAQEILDALSTSDIVLKIAVIVLVQEPGRQALRAIASLKGEYVLHALVDDDKPSFRNLSLTLSQLSE